MPFSPPQFGAAWQFVRFCRRALFASSNDLLLLESGRRQLSRVLPRKLSRYKNLDILGPYAAFENVKENDFCEKPASFEDKVRDVVAPVHRDQ